MPSRQPDVRTITRDELPQLLAQWQRESRTGLVLLRRGFTVNRFVENGWRLEEVFVRDDSVTWDDLEPIVACSSLQRLALVGVALGDAGARAIAEKLTILHTLNVIN